MNSFIEGLKAFMFSSFFHNILGGSIGGAITFIGVLLTNKHAQKRTLLELSYNKKYELYQKLLDVINNLIESTAVDKFDSSDIVSFLQILEECELEVRMLSPKKICDVMEILVDNLFQLVVDSKEQDNESFDNHAFNKLLGLILKHRDKLTMLIRKDLGSKLK